MSVKLTNAREVELADELNTSEWFDAVPAGPLGAKLPESNADHFYFATRILSWFPVVNKRGATYESEDFDDALLNTLIGKQVNLLHDKEKQVVGNIKAVEKHSEGIDVIVEVDRDQASAHGFDPLDMRPGQALSRVSVEITKNPQESFFYSYDENKNIDRRISVPIGRALGIRRTTENDPYLLQGKQVAERIKPERFTGLGIVPNPADITAIVYALAADATAPERLKMLLDTQDQVREATSYFAVADNRQRHTTDELTLIDARIKAAQKRHEISDAPSQGEVKMSDAAALAELQVKFSALELQVLTLTSQKELASTEAARVPDLVAQLAAKETELASVTAERDTLKTEKEVAARAASIEKIVADLEAIHPSKDDAARAARREIASHACDDAGRIHTLGLEATVAAQAEKIAELTPPVDEAAVAAAAVAETARIAAEAETARVAAEAAEAAEAARLAAATAAGELNADGTVRESFSATPPAVSFRSQYVDQKGQPITVEVLDSVF